MEIQKQDIGPTSPFSWAVAVFAARETPDELLLTSPGENDSFIRLQALTP